MSFFATHSHRVLAYTIVITISVFVIVASFWYKNQRITEEYEKASSETLLLQRQSEKEVNEKNAIYEVHVTFPVLQAVEGASSANTYLRTLYRTKINDFITQAQDAASEAKKYGNPVSVQSYFIVSPEEISKTGRYTSLLVRGEMYMVGAAHPSHSIDTFIFDTQEKKLVEVSSLFNASSSYFLTLSKLSKEAFREKNTQEVSIDISSENHGFDPITTNYSKILLEQNGIVIYFDEYQIAPYSNGPQEVHIPYTKLQGIINNSSVLGKEIQ